MSHREYMGISDVHLSCLRISTCIHSYIFWIVCMESLFGVWARDGKDKLQDSEVRRQFDTANLRLRAVVRVFLTSGLVWICDIASWALRWRYIEIDILKSYHLSKNMTDQMPFDIHMTCHFFQIRTNAATSIRLHNSI